MVTLIIISLLLSAFSGGFRAVSNKVMFHYNQSIFRAKKWFNPALSWKNKYKDGIKSKGAKFFGSTTFLVAFTDAWHLFELLHRICFAGCYVLCGVLLSEKIYFIFLIIGNYILFSIIFHLFFTYIFHRQP